MRETGPEFESWLEDRRKIIVKNYDSGEDPDPFRGGSPSSEEPKIEVLKRILKNKSANAALERLRSKSTAGGGSLTNLMDVSHKVEPADEIELFQRKRRVK